MNNSDDDRCEVCEAFARLDREIPKGHWFFDECPHRGYRRFVWFGTVPTTITEVDKLCRELKEGLKLSKKRGPKKKQKTIFDIELAIDALPATATITEVAGKLGISEKTIQRILDRASRLGPEYRSFLDLQRSIKGEKGPRFKKSFFKKIRRR